ncbi:MULTISPECIES: hypothetical protein [unclassified Agrobacterium]|uniref:hypothetical protein n=1 Tax=unclassified Agrobacterium TaxID=2632611 RepID=UPI00244C6B5B|nr:MULTISPECIES: hypothetical protein [unclassified Agrobacterium]MDH0614159.1 hypothetical protein [Agrobacterium sp. GD03872]MDH0695546.1 hypothetical protein [Agrobacterium sp. GD03871]MDH1058448.1 hypothetical protein [Agrobacterium sp. GD03992]MDH2209610.1 hypothetical protein [Agrobacterium sp. GD03643]MDH2219014.1 hypothetical protein [Agrobacterium sp. GD03638]
MANGDTQFFKATLYFDSEPTISDLTLMQAWGEEGYECERLSEKGVFDGLRGSTRIFVGTQQIAAMLAFGTFVTEEGENIRAWTTGLEHFGQTNLLFETPAGDATQALLTLFGLGHLIVNGRRFAAGEAITSFDLLARFTSAELDARPMLRVIRQDAG